MKDLIAASDSIKIRKAIRRKNFILVFGICISLIIISSFFALPESNLTHDLPIEEKVLKIPASPASGLKSDTTALINHNRKIHHNFLVSYLLQESSLKRKTLANNHHKGLLANPVSRFTIALHQLFRFH